MPERFTRNHIAVQDEGELVVLGVSDFLRQALGDDVVFKFRGAGTRVERGGVFGKALGKDQGCSLYAPFSFLVEEQPTTDHLSVWRLEGEPEPMLDEAEYARYVDSLPS